MDSLIVRTLRRQAEAKVRSAYEGQIQNEIEVELDRLAKETLPTDARIFQTANELVKLMPEKVIQCKLIRTAFGLGLKDSKDIIDAARFFQGKITFDRLSPEAVQVLGEMERFDALKTYASELPF